MKSPKLPRYNPSTAPQKHNTQQPIQARDDEAHEHCIAQSTNEHVSMSNVC